MKNGALGIYNLLIKGFILLLVHGTVYVIVLASVISRGGEGTFHVDALPCDNGGGGVVKAQMAEPEKLGNRFGKTVGCQRPGGNDAGTIGNFGYFL